MSFDPLMAQVKALRGTAAAMVAQCDALIAGLGEIGEPETEATAQCPKCGETRYQAQASGVTVCGGCNANHKNGELV